MTAWVRIGPDQTVQRIVVSVLKCLALDDEPNEFTVFVEYELSPLANRPKPVRL
jgi:hypothetical protein